jgi:hypothetical protein
MVIVSAYLENANVKKQQFSMSIMDRALPIHSRKQGCRNGAGVSVKTLFFF